MATAPNRPDPIGWLAEHWPKATPFLAIYTTAFLWLYVRPENELLFLIWLQTPVYFLHQFEEYVFPGGFAEFFNGRVLNSRRPDWPITGRFSLWINVPLIFVAFPLSALLAGFAGLGWGIWTAYFSILNGLSHVVMFARFGYNPGFAVSLVLNIPIGLYTVATLLRDGGIPIPAHLAGLAVALLAQAGLMLWGLVVLRRRVAQSA